MEKLFKQPFYRQQINFICIIINIVHWKMTFYIFSLFRKMALYKNLGVIDNESKNKI